MEHMKIKCIKYTINKISVMQLLKTNACSEVPRPTANSDTNIFSGLRT